MAVASPDDLAAWIGRSKESWDTLTKGPLDRLAATLDQARPYALDDDAVLPLGHWLYFLPHARQSEIGRDGHPRAAAFCRRWTPCRGACGRAAALPSTTPSVSATA
jgi:hydroxyacyl-ACP dehydratase HTD2-like protein with hotdog domain